MESGNKDMEAVSAWKQLDLAPFRSTRNVSNVPTARYDSSRFVALWRANCPLQFNRRIKNKEQEERIVNVMGVPTTISPFDENRKV